MAFPPIVSRYIFITLAALVMAYLGYTSWEKSQEEEGRQVAAEAQAAALKADVLRRATSVNALIDWPTRLASGQPSRLSPVLTAEIQNLWLAGQPILFVGKVDDVARSDTGNYTVKATYEGLAQSHLFISTDFRVTLECPEQLATAIIQALRKPDSFSIEPDVALVARIDQVTQTTDKDLDGNSMSILTGVGKCVDAVPLTGAMKW